jgi:hypothetical protein
MDTPDTPVVGESMPPEPGRGGAFKGAVAITVLIGAGLAAVMIFHLQAPPPKLVKGEREVVVIEKEAPPPKIIIQKESPPPPPPAPPPLPPLAVTPARSAWEGIWRRKTEPLPMFAFKQSGRSVSGVLSPIDLGPAVPFKDGVDLDGVLEFVVDDKVFRAHFRMILLDDNKAKLESWVTDEDFLVSLERAKKAVKTPQQGLVTQLMLDDSAKRRKPRTVGTFWRQEEP